MKMNVFEKSYAKIPKSLFATVAWYLADVNSEKGAGNDQAIERFIEEIIALRDNGILPSKQANKALRALMPQGKNNERSKTVPGMYGNVRIIHGTGKALRT